MLQSGSAAWCSSTVAVAVFNKDDITLTLKMMVVGGEPYLLSSSGPLSLPGPRPRQIYKKSREDPEIGVVMG